MTVSCPCCSGLAFSACCEPFISGRQHAPTPGKLMRSRYTAYVKRDVDYLITTWHPDCHAEEWRNAIIASVKDTQWLKLTLIEESIGKNADEGFVEFFAHFTDGSTQRGTMHERSRFLRQEQHWYYIDGTQPSLGRNAVCPCGSGKKYKKCCRQ